MLIASLVQLASADDRANGSVCTAQLKQTRICRTLKDTAARGLFRQNGQCEKVAAGSTYLSGGGLQRLLLGGSVKAMKRKKKTSEQS
jgi:hypothetical protein